MRWLLFGLAFSLIIQASPVDRVDRQLKAISDAHPEILFMAVVFNERTHGDLELPSQVGHIRLIAVPVSSPRDFYGALTYGLLRTNAVQALFLLDDGEKLVTRRNTLKYLSKQAAKYQFMLFSNADESNGFLTGVVAMRQDDAVLIEEPR